MSYEAVDDGREFPRIPDAGQLASVLVINRLAVAILPAILRQFGKGHTSCLEQFGAAVDVLRNEVLELLFGVAGMAALFETLRRFPAGLLE
jgi:hypothetical protein